MNKPDRGFWSFMLHGVFWVTITLLAVGAYITLPRLKAIGIAWKYYKQVETIEFKEQVEITKK